MTMFRDLTMLDYKKCPVTAAEGIEKEWEWQGTLVSIGAVGNRAWWESGYEAGLKNVTNKPRLLEQLREYEQVVMGLQVTVMAQQSTIAENDKRIASLERERTAVRESLGNLYIPILEVGTDTDTGESFYLDQGVHLAMEALQDAQARIEQLEAALRPFAHAAQYVVHNLPDTVAIWAKTDRAADNGLVAEITIGDLKRVAELLPQQD